MKLKPMPEEASSADLAEVVRRACVPEPGQVFIRERRYSAGVVLVRFMVVRVTRFRIFFRRDDSRRTDIVSIKVWCRFLLAGTIFLETKNLATGSPPVAVNANN